MIAPLFCPQSLDNLGEKVQMENSYPHMSSIAVRVGKIIIFRIYINVSNSGGSVDGVIATSNLEFVNADISTPIAYDYTMPQRIYKSKITSDGSVYLTASVSDRALGVVVFGVAELR